MEWAHNIKLAPYGCAPLCLFIMQSKTSTGSFVSQRHQQRVPQKSKLTMCARHHIHQFVHVLLSFRNPPLLCYAYVVCIILIVTAAGKNDTSCTLIMQTNGHKLNDLLLMCRARTLKMNHTQRDMCKAWSSFNYLPVLNFISREASFF